MKQPIELYACIYVREFPAQSLLRLQPELKDRACVVMDGEPPFEEVCSLNTKAKLVGIQRAMKRTDVEGFPGAKILSRSLKTESIAKDVLHECAYTYSPRTEDSSTETYFLCVIDIAGTEYLFGPPDKLAHKLLQHVQSLGFSARVIISHNFHTSVCLAKESSGRSIQVVSLGEEAAKLSCLPLDVLPLTADQTEIFALWGIHTLGMLAALPTEELIARIGQDGNKLQQLASGKLPHLFQPIEIPFKIEERHELEFPLDSLDSLMFGIAVMLEQLILRAKMRLVSLAAVTLSLELDGGITFTRRVRPAQPGNDKQFWVRLLHLDLQAHPPQAAVLAVTIQAEPGDMSKVQLGLFSPPLPEAARLDVTIAQLKNLLGEENVGQAVLVDSHAPESFQVEHFTVPSGSCMTTAALRQRTATRQLRPSEMISVQLHHSQPKEFLFNERRFVVERAYGPWIAGGGWWNEMLWNVEQWDVMARASSGSPLYCCVTHDLLQNVWQVTALYD